MRSSGISAGRLLVGTGSESDSHISLDMIKPKIPARRAFGSEDVGGSGKHPNIVGRGDGPTTDVKMHIRM